MPSPWKTGVAERRGGALKELCAVREKLTGDSRLNQATPAICTRPYRRVVGRSAESPRGAAPGSGAAVVTPCAQAVGARSVSSVASPFFSFSTEWFSITFASAISSWVRTLAIPSRSPRTLIASPPPRVAASSIAMTTSAIIPYCPFSFPMSGVDARLSRCTPALIGRLFFTSIAQLSTIPWHCCRIAMASWSVTSLTLPAPSSLGPAIGRGALGVGRGQPAEGGQPLRRRATRGTDSGRRESRRDVGNRDYSDSGDTEGGRSRCSDAGRGMYVRLARRRGGN